MRRSGQGPPGATQKLGGLEQWQADHIGIASRQELDEAGSATLDRVASGFATPFARFDISADPCLAQIAEAYDAADQALGPMLAGVSQGYRGDDAMAASGEQQQAGLGLFGCVGFWQDSSSHGHYSVGCEHETFGIGNGGGLGTGESPCTLARKLA